MKISEINLNVESSCRIVLLAKSDNKILDLQADIKKIEAKIERLKFAVEFKEK